MRIALFGGTGYVGSYLVDEMLQRGHDPVLLDRWSFFPLTREQLTMLLEGNTCDSSQVFEEFGLEALPFSIENLDYLSDQA